MNLCGLSMYYTVSSYAFKLYLRNISLLFAFSYVIYIYKSFKDLHSSIVKYFNYFE